VLFEVHEWKHQSRKPTFNHFSTFEDMWNQWNPPHGAVMVQIHSGITSGYDTSHKKTPYQNWRYQKLFALNYVIINALYI
jgi:hypothetical protein